MIIQDMVKLISTGSLLTALEILYDTFNTEELKSYHSFIVNYSSRVNRAIADERRGIGSASNTITQVENSLNSTLNSLEADKYTLSLAETAYWQYQKKHKPIVTNVNTVNTTVNNITVAAPTPAKNDKFDPFYLAPEVTDRIETFMSLIRKYIILAAQVNMILPEIYDNCIEFIGELQESLMSFVTSENSEERDEILESLEEYRAALVELETTARKEFKRAQGSEKNQVAQILKEVKVGNAKNLSLFKSAYAVFEQLDKGHLVSVPKVLPVNATSLGLLVKKWIRLANS